MVSATYDRFGGLAWATAVKMPVVAATTDNITRSGTQTVDGVVLAYGDRVLVKDQTTTSENGIYIVRSGTWPRANDFNETRDIVTGTRVYVISGTVNAGADYVVTSTSEPTLGTDSITFGAAALDGILSRTYTTTGGTARTLRSKIEEIWTPEDEGAAGNATSGTVGTDDAAAIQAALDQRGVVHLRPGSKYRVASRITIPAGGALIGDGSQTIFPDMTAFTNATRGGENDATGSIIYAAGELTGSYTPLAGVTIRGFKITGSDTDARITAPVCVRNASDVIIEDLDISDFAVGAGIVLDSVVGRSRVLRNKVRDWYTNHSWPDNLSSQTTGIRVDDNRVNSIASDGIEIAQNHVIDLVKGATTSGLWGEQTDGIHIAGATTKNCWVHHNRCEGVDEGVDCYGQSNQIEDNVVLSPTSAGVKIIHGASKNVVRRNRVTSAGLWAFTCRGTAQNNATADNIFEYNIVDGLGASAYGFDIGDNEASAYACTGTISRGNSWDATGGVSCIRHELTQGYLVSEGDDFKASGSSGYVPSNSAERVIIRNPVNRPFAKLTMSATQTLTASGKVLFDTAAYDSRSEFNATDDRIVAKFPGWRRIYAQVRYGDSPASLELGFGLSVSGTEVSRKWFYLADANPRSFTIEATVFVNEGQYIEATIYLGAATSDTITNDAAHSFLIVETL